MKKVTVYKEDACVTVYKEDACYERPTTLPEYITWLKAKLDTVPAEHRSNTRVGIIVEEERYEDCGPYLTYEIYYMREYLPGERRAELTAEMLLLKHSFENYSAHYERLRKELEGLK